jgi:hypothetical protein
LAFDSGREAAIRRSGVEAVLSRRRRRRVVGTANVRELLSGGDFERPLLDGWRKRLLRRPRSKLVLYVELVLRLKLRLRLLELRLERRSLVELLLGLRRKRRSAGVDGRGKLDVERVYGEVLVEYGSGVDVELGLE